MIDVYLYDVRAATLERLSHSNYRLQYTQEWLAHSNAVPLSTLLPLDPRPHTGERLLRVLAGFLPDRSDVLERWSRVAGLPDAEVYGLLEHYGEDTSGAAVFVPSGTDPRVTHDHVPLSTASVAQRIRDVRADSAAWVADAAEHRFSLAGMQGKFTLARRGNTWFEPHGTEPSTHILKPGIDKYEDSDLLEHVTMRAFGELGLPVAETSIEVFEDQRILAVQRFDRVHDRGSVIRLHQEDFAQATGTSPAQKYQDEGGPSPSNIARVLRRETAPERLQESLFYYGASLVASWLLVHNDGHAKNYSLRLLPDRTELAPLYDVNSHLPYLGSERLLGNDPNFAHEIKLAYAIDGKSRVGDLGVTEFKSLERTLALPENTLVGFARQAAQSLMPAVNAAIDTLPNRFHTATIDRFRRGAYLRTLSARRTLGMA